MTPLFGVRVPETYVVWIRGQPSCSIRPSGKIRVQSLRSR